MYRKNLAAPVSDLPSENQLLKMSTDTLDLVILRILVDSAMTRRSTTSPGRMDKLVMARDLLIELQMEVRL